MKDFSGKLAVVTGGGSGMGQELARQLVIQGCDVAICDVNQENMQQTIKICEAEGPQGIRITAHQCDVSNEQQVLRFKDEVIQQHDRDHINLLFNNAGIGGFFSFIKDTREEWEKTFNICWYGVYYCSRAFVPLLIASDEGHIINTSSINGFWASLGPDSTHTAYSAAKFAVKGFTEALINDFRLNAPHVKVSVVMPGHIGTSILDNTRTIMGAGDADSVDADRISELRQSLASKDANAANATDDEIRALLQKRADSFRDNAPTSAAQAAADIISGVQQDRWRILLGDDARALDRLVRETPEEAYEAAFYDRWGSEGGWK
ncbi:MAG: SDR family oxidoreductase [Pseudomonadales bacterium]|nr:SDR family oxidoreductase [Pseudomonadales bacterium]